MEKPEEVSALNSHAVLISELTNTRNHLRILIAKIKKIAGAIPLKEREELIAVAMEADRALK